MLPVDLATAERTGGGLSPLIYKYKIKDQEKTITKIITVDYKDVKHVSLATETQTFEMKIIY